jgi:hypothetical protein
MRTGFRRDPPEEETDYPEPDMFGNVDKDTF